jgi:carboxyl-terminal processing protease
MIVWPQTNISQSRSGTGSLDPFRIKTGSSFSASSSSSSRSSVNAARDRARVIDDLREAEAIIANNYAGRTPDIDDLTTNSLRSMLHELDPHSNYYDASEWKELLDEQKSGYAGIGVSIGSYRENGIDTAYVIGTADNSPARRAGLKYGDKIVAVNGRSVIGTDTTSVSGSIRGNVGTSVRITIARNGSGPVETVELRRVLVSQPSIPVHYMVSDGVGFIGLTEGFNYTTSDEFAAALKDLHRVGITSLIVDLRGNGGGIVDQAVKVAETFLPAGTLIVSQRGRTASETFEWRSNNLKPETLPLVLIVDENTASASEIVAGALQDTDRALIVGSKTFGKGLVQSVIDLPQQTGATLTAARYFTPSGRSIQREYTDVGRYDYFNHRGPVSAIDTPHFEARTITGRRVTGGDGITPDEQVRSESMTPAQSVLLDPIFFFVRDLLSGRIDGVRTPRFTKDNGTNQKLTAANQLVPNAFVSEFEKYVRGQNFNGINAETFQNETRFIDLRIRYEIAIAQNGTDAATRVITEQDSELAAAIKLLPKAGQLAATAARYFK